MRLGKFFCLSILLISLMALALVSPVLAQDEEPVAESVELITDHLTQEQNAGTSFTFDVDLKYQGSEPHFFDLKATGPADWTVYVTDTSGSRIVDLRLEPGKTYGQTVNVVAYPPYIVDPEPTAYTVTLEVSSGDIKGSIDLNAVITAAYRFTFAPTDGIYSTRATSGQDNYYYMVIQNTGSGTITDIKFSSQKPTGWTIEFSPPSIDSLPPGSYQTVDVNIKPGPKSIAGRYEITLNTNTEETSIEQLDIMVDVETPSVWGWVGIAIILLVIVGVAFIFIRFSRR